MSFIQNLVICPEGTHGNVYENVCQVKNCNDEKSMLVLFIYSVILIYSTLDARSIAATLGMLPDFHKEAEPIVHFFYCIWGEETE